MDPNAALKRIREIHNDYMMDKPFSGTAEITDELITLIGELDGWIMQGGWLPLDWQNSRGGPVTCHNTLKR